MVISVREKSGTCTTTGTIDEKIEEDKEIKFLAAFSYGIN